MLASPHALQQLRGSLLEQELLTNYTSWHVGGKADLIYLPADIKDIAHFLEHLPLDIPLLWLGLGSNVLIRDGGVDGAVIVTQGALNEISQYDSQIVRVEAGVSCAQIAHYTASLGWAGLEFMAGIPGTIGGALTMNAGCYGSETWQFVRCVETIDRVGQVHLRSPSDYAVSYRNVIGPPEEWYVAAHFELSTGDQTRSQADIRILLEKRKTTQPMGFSHCGSIFCNPPGNYAARLIEQCGLKKMSIGGAYVSDKHANFIINDGTATAADIERLIEHITAVVERQHGIRLMRKVRIIGKTVSG